MKAPRHPALSSIILGLALLPSVYGYDCNILTSTTQCSQDYSGPRRSYPGCLVSQLSASAFIQCASQKGSDNFVTIDDGDTKSMTPLDVLTQAISIPACDNCPLADKIQRVAMTSNRGPNDVANFGNNLCAAKPADVGMCCLKKCLGGSPEHSIQAFCTGTDFMQAPLLPDGCISNGASNDDSSSSDTSSDDSSSSDTSSDDSSSSNTSSDGISSVTSDLTTPQTTSSTLPTTSVAANDNARPVSTSNAASTPQATPNSGAALGRQHPLMDLARKLGVAILPLAAAF